MECSGVGGGLGCYIEWASPLSGDVFVFTFHLKLPMPHISHMVTTFTVELGAPSGTNVKL